MIGSCYCPVVADHAWVVLLSSVDHAWVMLLSSVDHDWVVLLSSVDHAWVVLLFDYDWIVLYPVLTMLGSCCCPVFP